MLRNGSSAVLKDLYGLLHYFFLRYYARTQSERRVAERYVIAQKVCFNCINLFQFIVDDVSPAEAKLPSNYKILPRMGFPW